MLNHYKSSMPPNYSKVLIEMINSLPKWSPRTWWIIQYFWILVATSKFMKYICYSKVEGIWTKRANFSKKKSYRPFYSNIWKNNISQKRISYSCSAIFQMVCRWNIFHSSYHRRKNSMAPGNHFCNSWSMTTIWSLKALNWRSQNQKVVDLPIFLKRFMDLMSFSKGMIKDRTKYCITCTRIRDYSFKITSLRDWGRSWIVVLVIIFTHAWNT